MKQKKTLLIIGLGVCGSDAKALAEYLGYQVVTYDDKDFAEHSIRAKGEYIERLLSSNSISSVIISPGIDSRRHPLVCKVRERDIPIVGEASFALQFLKTRAIGITGTNGKTTLCSFLKHVLTLSGISCEVIGNNGLSISRYVLSGRSDQYVIIELSSFQLETLSQPLLDYGIITNISPDHLSRYQNFNHYQRTKLLIEKCLKKDGKMIAPMSFKRDVLHGIKDRKKWIWATYQDWSVHRHLFNQETQGVILALSTYLEIKPKVLDRALRTFQKLPTDWN